MFRQSYENFWFEFYALYGIFLLCGGGIYTKEKKAVWLRETNVAQSRA